MPGWVSLRASTSRPGSWRSRKQPTCCAANSESAATRPARSRSARTPIRTSRSKRELKITRQILEVLSEARHPAGIVTKSALVLRDLDLIAPMARDGLMQVMVSVTTLDRRLARIMEPRAATPERRLSTVRALREAGVPVGVLASPMIPALNDAELEAILEAAAAAGAVFGGFILVRLPHELKGLFGNWLETHFPTRAAHIQNLIREARGGKLYEAKFGERMRGRGPYAELLAQRFRVASRRLGLDRPHPGFRTDLFRPPRAAGASRSLFAARP